MSPSLARIAISRVVPMSDSCHPRITVNRVSPLLGCHHQLHGAPEQCPSPTHRHCLHITVRVAIGHMVPLSDARHPRVTVDHVSPSLARHHQLHGAPKQCPSPTHHRCLCITVCVTISCMVPLSDAHHPHIAINHASPSLTCYRQLHGAPKQCPSPTRHRLHRCRPHGAHEQRLSPTHRCCLRVTVHVTISRMVPTSNACYPHVTVAVDVPPPYPT